MEELKCFLEDPANSKFPSFLFSLGFFWGGFGLFVCFVVGFLGGWAFVVLLVFENVITCFVTMDNGSIAMEPSSERGHLCFIQPVDMVAEN